MSRLQLRIQLFLLQFRAQVMTGTLLALILIFALVRAGGIRIPLLGQVTAQAACNDSIDNDGDGDIDYPADLGCLTAREVNEWQNAECFDGFAAGPLDNDEDGAANRDDFSCIILFNGEKHPRAFCGDEKDNDLDGFTDFPSDPGCNSLQDHSENN